MKEKVFDFGENNSLSGVATLPGERGKRSKTAVILLNSGLIHRVGPSRLYVKLARLAAEMGFLAFRLDFSGIGDSEVRTDNLPFAKSSVAETQTAMDFLNQKLGVTSFILTGICAGGDVAFETAKCDPRVRAILPIDFFNIPSKGYHLQRYKQRMLRMESWKRLLSGKSDLWSRVKKSSEPETLLQEQVEQTVEIFENFLDENSIGSDTNVLLRNDVSCCFLYSSESAGFYNFQNMFKAQIDESPNFRMICIEESDHGFTLARSQTRLLAAIGEWLDRF